MSIADLEQRQKYMKKVNIKKYAQLKAEKKRIANSWTFEKFKIWKKKVNYKAPLWHYDEKKAKILCKLRENVL